MGIYYLLLREQAMLASEPPNNQQAQMDLGSDNPVFQI
jgi:hypothetical protein